MRLLRRRTKTRVERVVQRPIDPSESVVRTSDLVQVLNFAISRGYTDAHPQPDAVLGRLLDASHSTFLSRDEGPPIVFPLIDVGGVD